MRKLSRAERVAILRCLVDGVSIRGTCRITGKAKATVLKLLCDVGAVCAPCTIDHRTGTEPDTERRGPPAGWTVDDQPVGLRVVAPPRDRRAPTYGDALRRTIVDLHVEITRLRAQRAP